MSFPLAFADPRWLIGIIPVVLIYLLMRVDLKRRREKWARLIDPSLWPRVAPEYDPKAAVRKTTFVALAVVCLILAAARPLAGSHEEVVKAVGLDLLFVVDVSNSMEAEDVVPNRLKKAKHAVRSIVERLNGDRAGIVAFAASSYLTCPLTTDLGYLLESLDALSPAVVVNQGTDIGIALETAAAALERSAEESPDPRLQGADPGAVPVTRAVVLISDGEDFEQKAVEGARKLKEQQAHLYVLGVGTEAGAPIPVRDERGVLRGYKRDEKNQAATSRFRPAALQKLAQVAGGKYWTLSESETEVDQILHELGLLDRTAFAERRIVVPHERFQWPLALGLILLVWELFVPARRLARVATDAPGAVSVLLFILSLALSFAPSLAVAQGSVGVYLENEDGLKAFEQGKIEEARRHFGSAQAQRPDSPELQHNQGVIQMEQEDIEGAERSFEAAAGAASRADDPELMAKSLYNLGAAREKAKQTDAAMEAFAHAIASAKRAKNPKLEEQARQRLELLAQKNKQKNSQSQSDGDSDQQQDPSGQQNPEQKSSDEKGEKDDQKEGSQEKKPERYDQGKDREKEREKKGFRSERLSPEDAKRVMDELSNRERELQKRLKKQPGARQSRPKDW